MDAIDQKILRELQRDGRLSNNDLAERVNLSPSPCLRRVRKLERDGVIQGYSARVDRKAVGLPVRAFVMVTIEKHSEQAIQVFEQGIRDADAIRTCHLLTGSHDYLLDVATDSLAGYERFMRTTLNRIPGITSIETTFAIGEVKAEGGLPL